MATFMSDGFVAMQCSLVPRIANERFTPVIAAQPEPGSRLLHGIAVSRKYMQRVRCRRLPAVVAMLRSCADAPDFCALLCRFRLARCCYGLSWICGAVKSENFHPDFFVHFESRPRCFDTHRNDKCCRS